MVDARVLFSSAGIGIPLIPLLLAVLAVERWGDRLLGADRRLPILGLLTLWTPCAGRHDGHGGFQHIFTAGLNIYVLELVVPHLGGSLSLLFNGLGRFSFDAGMGNDLVSGLNQGDGAPETDQPGGFGPSLRQPSQRRPSARSIERQEGQPPMDSQPSAATAPKPVTLRYSSRNKPQYL